MACAPLREANGNGVHTIIVRSGHVDKKATRDDGTLYYEYLVCYVDDLIICSQKPAHVIQELRDSGYELKGCLLYTSDAADE